MLGSGGDFVLDGGEQKQNPYGVVGHGERRNRALNLCPMQEDIAAGAVIILGRLQHSQKPGRLG